MWALEPNFADQLRAYLKALRSRDHGLISMNVFVLAPEGPSLCSQRQISHERVRVCPRGA
jgi:hypothetical protein